ncbi:MAG TPA: magnesium transporter [Xanthomonadales bacterium]|nr:magnesium transporter [Xanthomonadales bacterium]
MNLNAAIKETYLREQPVAAAKTIEKMPNNELPDALQGLDGKSLAQSLEVLTTSRLEPVFKSLEDQQRVAVLEAASPRLALVLLKQMDEQARLTLLDSLPAGIRADLERLAKFEENTAGRLMDRPFETIRADMNVSQVLGIIRQSGVSRARSFYVVNDENVLVGKVDMQTLALADSKQPLQDLLAGLEGSVLPTAGREEIVEQLDRYRVDSVPVVDVQGRLMGIVRYHRLFEAVESLATADLQKMVGASADERALSPPMFAIKRRLPWLHINLLTAFLAAAVVGLFENLIAQFTALAVLLPVVAGQSGNAGSQALAVTMRGLALREIGTREWNKVLNKEVQVGLIDGLALAVTCGLGVFAWSRSFGLALVIAVAMVLSMVAAGISGALVPIVLTRLGQDPATAASIILTTVTDVVGFFAFLGTATLLSFML